MQGPVLVDSMAQEEMKESLEIPRGGGKKGPFPPPLPSLARKSYNHLPLQVPWVLLHANRSNNRVVLHEVKTPQQMLFQPIRKHGRLVLHMLRHDSSDEETDEDYLSSTALSSSPTTSSASSLATVSSADEDSLRASV